MSPSYDPTRPEVRRDPYPHFRELRRDAPVHFVPSTGFYAVARMTDVREVLRDGIELFSGSDGPAAAVQIHDQGQVARFRGPVHAHGNAVGVIIRDRRHLRRSTGARHHHRAEVGARRVEYLIGGWNLGQAVDGVAERLRLRMERH